MALTKREASGDFECVLRDVPITGTNHSSWYAQFLRDNPGQDLEDIRFSLVRDRTNGHDPYAVKVMVRYEALSNQEQVGWIGQQTGHSAQVASLLDGAGAYILITQHYPGGQPMKRLYGDVYLPKRPANSQEKVQLNGPVISDIYTDGGSQRAKLIKHAGRILNLVSNEARVSVTLQDASGATVGWYRKSEYPAVAHRADLAGKVALVITNEKVMIITKGQADVNGYTPAGSEPLISPKVATPVRYVVEEHFESPPRPSNAHQSSTKDYVRSTLFIPKTLHLLENNHSWLISEDGDHWLHLIERQDQVGADLAARLDIARRYAFDNFTSHYPADFYLHNEPKTEVQTQPPKETAMKTQLSTILSTNKQAATSAAYLEAGRIANNAFASFAADKAPFFAKGYINTPIGKLVLANIAAVAQRELRPNDVRLQRLVEAMTTQSFLEIYGDFDIEGQLEQLLSNSTIKRALDKLDADSAAKDKGND